MSTRLEDSVALTGPYCDQPLLGLKKGVEMFRRRPELPSTIRGPRPAALRALKGLPPMGEGGGGAAARFG
ncbi:MAG TPA: hypothetical protein VLV86_00270 [Vicinamibacterales bacterium]|nr:hypothetical protein [Vicinamibacterales bacterium]